MANLAAKWSNINLIHERRAFRQLRKELNRVTTTFARNYIRNPDYNGQILFKDHKKETDRILRINYSKAIETGAKFSQEQIEDITKSVIHNKDDIFDFLVASWIETTLDERLSFITRTTADEIKDTISTGVAEGESTAAIAANITKLSAVNRVRAAVIARTEVNNAANFANLESAKRSAETLKIKMKKVWLPVNDARTRDTHSSMTSHPPIGLREKFSVGLYQADRPHDATLPPEETIQCRCTLIFEPEE